MKLKKFSVYPASPSMKTLILRTVGTLGGRAFIRHVNFMLRKLVNMTHYLQYTLEWRAGLTANWFDHHLDLYSLWSRTRSPMGMERGIFSLLAIRQGAKILELCCGDGFYSNYFYSVRGASVTAVDIDPNAIASARKNYSARNVKYAVTDIVNHMPQENFDNVIWDSALEYFNEEEIHSIMKGISARLNEGGVLSGHVVLQEKFNEGQKYAFRNKADFMQFAHPYFKNIRTFESVYPDRRNLYFFAGNGSLPFDANWSL